MPRVISEANKEVLLRNREIASKFFICFTIYYTKPSDNSLNQS